MQPSQLSSSLFEVLVYAAQLHQYQRRGGYDRLPYINHLIKVTNTLIQIGRETDETLLSAAILHDAIEDTEATHASIAARFGTAVADIVEELTDDMTLSYPKRKDLQIAGAPQLSEAAKKIRIADKACNIQDIFSYPLRWTKQRKRAYVINACAIVDTIRGTSPAVEAYFDQVVQWSQSRG
jgi:guanosine-3',5'-bis(diphosphate) 3'-pyrophosphohydrolase